MLLHRLYCTTLGCNCHTAHFTVTVRVDSVLRKAQLPLATTRHAIWSMHIGTGNSRVVSHRARWNLSSSQSLTIAYFKSTTRIIIEPRDALWLVLN